MRLLSRLVLLSTNLLALGLFAGCDSPQSLYDARVKGLLDKKDLTYEVDQDGDFKVAVPLFNSESQLVAHESVWIISYLKPYQDFQIREVFSLVIALPPNTPTLLLESLMADSYNNRFMGSWVMLERDSNTRYLAYLSKLITGDLTDKNLLPILQEVGHASYSMREVLLTSSPLLKQSTPLSPQPLWQGEDPNLYPPALDYPPAP